MQRKRRYSKPASGLRENLLDVIASRSRLSQNHNTSRAGTNIPLTWGCRELHFIVSESGRGNLIPCIQPWRKHGYTLLFVQTYSEELGNQTMFTLHPRLEADCIVLGDFPLCRLLLMNDARYPWFVLVPRRADISEIYQLVEREQLQLQRESVTLGQAIMEVFGGDKLNVAALGNLVPQLHIHHIVRYRDDATWPGPVWGVGISVPYTVEQVVAMRGRLHHFEGIEFQPA